MNPLCLVYWSRWITARRLSKARRKDPVWVSNLEYYASLANFNLQLDDIDVLVIRR